MHKYIKDDEVPFKSGKYVFIIENYNIDVIKHVLNSHDVKIIFEHCHNVVISKKEGKYYEDEHNKLININKFITKVMERKIVAIVVIAEENDRIIETLINDKSVIYVLNDNLDTDIAEINYEQIINVLIKHNLIGGRVGSFIGNYDNKTLQYVYNYDLKQKNCYGVKLDSVLTGEENMDLCDHLIKLYKEHKNKPVLEKSTIDSTTKNYTHIVVNYYGNVNACVNK